MAGSVTASQQDALSHLNVLAGQRGTPNIFVQDALQRFAPFEGQLVRLETRPNYYELRLADAAEAQAHWDEQRPKVDLGILPDPDYSTLPALTSLPAETAELRALNTSRIGAKASSLNTLFATQALTPAERVQGFAIPFRYYLEFMADNSWQTEVDGQLSVLSYAETIARWSADAEFNSDAPLRKTRLAQLRKHMRAFGRVDAALTARIEDAIITHFGSSQVMVRFRSSSNAEDSLYFNGAGIYDSTNACAADPLTGTATSACDPSKKPRSIARALAKVWSSLWNFGAYEEREYHQIEHSGVAMAILVSTRFPDEIANGVAMTGNPNSAKDARYTINVQLGDVSVVNSTPGVIAELDRLTLADGQVSIIDRDKSSSLVGEGEVVLSDDQLRSLGALMARVAEAYPVDVTPDDPELVLLDMEFKFDATGQLRIKQIRPFLRSSFVPSSLVCDGLGG